MTLATHDDVVRTVRIEYTNYRGETAWRTVIPKCIVFAANSWHPTPQWLLNAFDVDKQAERDFAIRDIKQWVTP